MRRLFTVPTALFVLALAAAATADAQRVHPRPDLPRGADANDWEAYYDRGVELFNGGLDQEGAAAFYWAHRLNPARAEPLYALRTAVFLSDIRRWERYREDSESVLRDPEIVYADSLLVEAMVRNPFVPPTLDIVLYNQLPGRWRSDRATQAWLHYVRGDLPQAARALGRLVESNPSGNYRWRYDLALAYVGMGQMDSAAAQVQAMIEELRRRDETRVVVVYESKDFLEYALGTLYWARRRYPEARQAMERALVENAAAYTAHRGLGLVAQAEGKHDEAAEHFGQAVELAGERPLFVYEHGRALSAAGRATDAVPVLARAVEAEPFWPEAQLELGRAHDRARNAPEALKAYERYLQLAPRKASSVAQSVRQRMEQLRAAAGGS